jgi:hypothetical protein
MEIRVNIPQNDYIQPTEVREDVVRKICDVFLDNRTGYYHNIFHPVNDGGYRVRTLGLRIHKKSGRAYEFDHKALFDSDDFVKFHGSEMKVFPYSKIVISKYMRKRMDIHRTFRHLSKR